MCLILCYPIRFGYHIQDSVKKNVCLAGKCKCQESTLCGNHIVILTEKLSREIDKHLWNVKIIKYKNSSMIFEIHKFCCKHNFLILFSITSKFEAQGMHKINH